MGDDVVVKFQKFIFPYSGLQPWILGFCVFIQVIYVTMVYGPIAAFLVELFPTKIRYTSMSLPYHIGNGVFGGLVPIIGLRLLTTPATTTPAVVADGRRHRLLHHRHDLGSETFKIDIHSGESAAYTAEHGEGSSSLPDEI